MYQKIPVSDFSIGSIPTIQDLEFNYLKNIIYEKTGISLAPHKKIMLQSRLNIRLRQNKISSFHDYVKKLKQEPDFFKSEIHEIINRITTNKTDFFRENHHFEYLKKTALPAIEEKARFGRKTVRIWCSASSTGEEPYSIAITLHDYFATKPGWDIKVFASDIDTNVLTHADKGIYKEDRFAAVPKDIVMKHFTLLNNSSDGKEYRIKPNIRELVTFKKINLLDPSYPFMEKFDIIFCRNVIIYFDKPTQKAIFQKMEKVLADEGLLIIGHSETLFGITENFKFLGHTIYQRKPQNQL
ncbi:MAG: protein-glutamate O-methyltransferase CheR [Leptospiraceae bacterium]|nr:protein-glutamate O-methyltransferase CheR [Leptospiraceae bacterium]MCP5511250.1 protein-glutamate O-methyltransferase CheR [Leptospiraceae bacterium]